MVYQQVIDLKVRPSKSIIISSMLSGTLVIEKLMRKSCYQKRMKLNKLRLKKMKRERVMHKRTKKSR